MTKRRAILVLGQKKSGTTSLYEAIAATGLTLIDIPKESAVMNAPKLLCRLLERAASDAVLIDATTTYFRNGAFSAEFAQSLAMFESVTVVFIYREENARLRSHYRHSINHDGWSGSPEAFIESEEYLNHARITPVITAVRALGIETIHVLPFSLLEEPERLADAVTAITKRRPDFCGVSAQNTFGSLQRLPHFLQLFLGTPLFQLVLRPLISSRIRVKLKRLLGAKSIDVDLEPLNRSEIQKIARTIDAENRALLALYHQGGSIK